MLCFWSCLNTSCVIHPPYHLHQFQWDPNVGRGGAFQLACPPALYFHQIVLLLINCFYLGQALLSKLMPCYINLISYSSIHWHFSFNFLFLQWDWMTHDSYHTNKDIFYFFVINKWNEMKWCLAVLTLPLRSHGCLAVLTLPLRSHGSNGRLPLGYTTTTGLDLHGAKKTCRKTVDCSEKGELEDLSEDQTYAKILTEWFILFEKTKKTRLELYSASQGPSSIVLKPAFQLSLEFPVDVNMSR